MERILAFLRQFGEITKEVVTKFVYDNGLNYSGSIAFFTIFSLPGVTIGIIWSAGMFIGEQEVQDALFLRIQSMIGSGSADQVRDVLQNLQSVEYSLTAATIAIATLIYGATSVFATIQDGINVIWELRPKPKRIALKFVLNRLVSLSMIIVIGFLLLVSFGVEAVLSLFSEMIEEWMGKGFNAVLEVFRGTFFFMLVWLIFVGIYKTLPDARISWRQVLPGALMATIFFVLGKIAIEVYLSHTSWGTAYGAAGSLVLILLWVYYSSIILLIGAEIVEVTNRRKGILIKPSKSSAKIIIKEIHLKEEG